MNAPIVRRATSDDAQALALVGSATFLESFAGTLPGSDIVAHCANKNAVSVFEDWTQRPECAVWMVDLDAVAVGYASLTPPDLPGATDSDIELRRIYVLSRFQGEGLGRRLMEMAIEEAMHQGCERLMLGVYGENHAAIEFYKKAGFDVVGNRTFTVGTKVCDDFVLARRL